MLHIKVGKNIYWHMHMVCLWSGGSCSQNPHISVHQQSTYVAKTLPSASPQRDRR